jgi:hypothetical protein
MVENRWAVSGSEMISLRGRIIERGIRGKPSG